MRTLAFISSAVFALCSGLPAQAQPAAGVEPQANPVQAEEDAAAMPGSTTEEPAATDQGTAEGPVDTAGEAVTTPPTCLAEPVVFRRFGLPEPQLVSLTDCEQRPNPAALPLISALAAPLPMREKVGEAQPATGDEPADADAPARLLNPQLLIRLQQIASRFQDRAIEIVSGYRTRARATSRHRTGDALDVRVEGVDNEELSIFARTLEETGVGYYPNSTFVHIDVREASAYWVDRSAPGERPDYVRERAGAASTPEPVLAGTPPDAERDILSAQLARALLDVHGPELPAYGQDDAPEPEPAAAQPAAAAPETADEVDAAQLDAEIEVLLERALVVMREANAAG